jgi:hypothetical protein
MPKVNTNSNINYFQTPGRVIQHDIWINQAVTQSSSPTFGNLFISGDTEIAGNLYVYGNTSIFNTNITEFEDNILLINRNETGSGVTLGLAGLEVSRGPSLEGFRAVFRESDDTFRIGFVNSTQAVATREDTPLNNGIAIWNNTEKRFDSRTTVGLSLDLNNTENAISVSTGTLRIGGGIGLEKDLYTNAKINFRNSGDLTWSIANSELVQTSTARIALRPNTDVYIPANKQLTFGETTNKIIADTFNNLSVMANGNIALTPGVGKKVSVPNLIPITFSTDLEKIYADSSNLVFTSSQDLQLTPTRNVTIPTGTPITFGTVNQRIFGNSFGDIIVVSNNNIQLTPNSGQDILVPQEAGVRFGQAARMWGGSSNALLVNVSGGAGVIITSGSVKLSNDTSLFIGPTEFRYVTSTSGSRVKAFGTVEIPNMIITTVSSGSLGVDGDAYIKGNTVIDGNLNVNGTTTTINTEVQLIKDNLIVVNSGPAGLADSGLLMKRFSDGVSSTVGNIYAGVVYQESSDQIILGYTTTDPGSGSPVSFSDYIPFVSNRITIQNTNDSVILSSVTSSSLVANGGAYFAKSVRLGTGGDLYVTENRKVLFGTAGSISGIGTTLTLDAPQTFISSTTDSLIDSTIGSLIVGGGQYIAKNLVLSNNGTAILKSTSGSHQIGGIIIQNNQIRSTTGTLVTFPESVRLTSQLYLDDYLYSQNTNGQLVLSSTTSSTSGFVISTEFLDILGATTITDSLELVEGSLFLNSGTSVFQINPTGNSLKITADSLSNLQISNLTVSISNSAGTNAVSFTPSSTGSNLELSTGIFTKILDQTNLNGTSYLRLDNSTTGTAMWFWVNITIPSNFVSVVNESFVLTSNDNTFDYSYTKERVNIRVYNTGLYVSVPANTAYKMSIFTRNTILNKISVSPVGSLPGTSLLYSTETIFASATLGIGDLYSYGTSAKIGDLKPIVGYKNSDTIGSTSVGVGFERSKTVVKSKQTPVYVITVPSQSGVTSTDQIKLGSSGPNVVLTGGIVEFGKLYRIKEYNPSIKVITLEDNLGDLPLEGDQIKIYDRSFADITFNETNTTMEVKYSPDNSIDPYIPFKCGDFTATRTVNIGGNTNINNTRNAESTSTGAFVVSGGISTSKNLIVGQSLLVTGNVGSSSGTSVTLDSTSLNGLNTLRANSNNIFSIVPGTGLGIYLSTSGQLSINTTSVASASTNLTFNSSGSIGIDNQNGSLNVLGRMRLYGDITNKVEISSGSFETNPGCIVTIKNTTTSSSNTTGALVVSGGLTVSGSTNAISSSVGGALTVAGGASVSKDLYIGGNLVINGTVEISGAVTVPTVTVDSLTLVNCNVATVVYTKLVKISLDYTLQVCLEINPNEAFQNTEIQFELPGRTDNFTNRTDLFTTSSGWSDNTALTPLFNVLSCGVPGTKRVIVKFQSISTNTHYLQVMCTYKEF